VRVEVVRQENRGVGGARNTGLDAVVGTATLVAFLDSDDTWPPGHLSRAVAAFEEGFDMTFADNSRTGHHESLLRLHCPETIAALGATETTGIIVPLRPDVLVGLILKEFPTQASTVVYSQDLAPRLRFNTQLQSAGEDVLFFATLAAMACRPGFAPGEKIECGQGVNIYFGHLSWDSPKYLSIKLDQYLAHRLVSQLIPMSSPVRDWNESYIRRLEEAFVFHLLRTLTLHPGLVAEPLRRLLRTHPGRVLLLPITALRVALRAAFIAAIGGRWQPNVS
jgi:succinoglycan biosynthesis protein ExoW